MTEGIPDDIVRALNAIGFVLFAENVTGEFSFHRYSPAREAELVMRREADAMWHLKLTARHKNGPWEDVGEWTPIAPEALTRDFLKRLLIST